MVDCTRSAGHYCMSDFQRLREEKPGLYILYRLGVGLGASVEQLLEMHTEDVIGMDDISICVGPRHIRRTFILPDELKTDIESYASHREAGRLFDGTVSTVQMELASYGLDTEFLRSVLVRYYRETEDPYYPLFFLGII